MIEAGGLKIEYSKIEQCSEVEQLIYSMEIDLLVNAKCLLRPIEL